MWNKENSNTADTLLDYAVRVFNSCTTYKQMLHGIKYFELAVQRDNGKQPIFAMTAVAGMRNIAYCQRVSEMVI